ncbi:MAG: indolepyruvate oxidoreductase subunit beta [Deltaproteobacteria bacterium]|nr:indolepyruvate oxidoreductase subunit beta [Deltaproteobacteria bacterium]
MRQINMVLCGLGGQGILFMTKVLARTALGKGMNVLGAETHGMAQRGGSVVSHLRLGNVNSSLVNAGECHQMLALEENEACRNLPLLAQGGTLFVNTNANPFPESRVQTYLNRLEIKCRSVSAGKIALDLGTPMASNLALIGFMSTFKESPFSTAEIRTTIDTISPDRFKTMNFKVFDAGCRWRQQADH